MGLSSAGSEGAIPIKHRAICWEHLWPTREDRILAPGGFASHTGAVREARVGLSDQGAIGAVSGSQYHEFRGR